MYASLARGPASLESERQLREECEALWRQGRQQCQAQSLWGHACLLAPHDTQVTVWVGGFPHDPLVLQ